MSNRRKALKRKLYQDGKAAFYRCDWRSSFPEGLYCDERYWLRGWDEAQESERRAREPAEMTVEAALVGYKLAKETPMTNPLEQIRELAEKWKYFHGRSDPYNAGVNDCGSELLAILAAHQGYVCVPVESIQQNAEDAKRLRAMERAMGELCANCVEMNMRAAEILREGEPHDQD